MNGTRRLRKLRKLRNAEPPSPTRSETHLSGIGFLRLDEKLRLLEVDPEAETLLRLPRGAGRGLRGASAHVLWGDRATALAFRNAVKNVKAHMGADLSVCLRDGTRRWFHFSCRGQQHDRRRVFNISFIDITPYKETEEQQRLIAVGLNHVVQIADLLMGCSTEDCFCRKAVELIRQRLQVERCALFMVEGQNMLRGTYGTDRSGRTTREHENRFPMPDLWVQKLTALDPEGPRTTIVQGSYFEFKKGRSIPFGEGWIALTPVLSADQLLGVLVNDTARSRRPVNLAQQKLLAVLGSIMGDMLIRIRSEARREAFAAKLRAVVRAADKLLACRTLDRLYRQAVELARSDLGVERCAIFLRQEHHLWGTYGTDRYGRTTREYDHLFPSTPEWLRRLSDLRHRKRRSLILEGPHHEWIDGKVRELGRGWVGITPVFSEKEFLGIICNDNAISGAPPDEAVQESLIVYGSLLGAIIERKRAEENQQRMSSGLRTIIELADELIACTHLDEFYRTAVEGARAKLAVERCAIFVFDGDQLRGTYGTNMHRQTTDEHAHVVPPHADWLRHFRAARPAERRIVLNNEPFTEWDGRQPITFDRGWVVLTPIYSASQPVGVFSNDTAITRKPIDDNQQELISVYCSLLGALIEQKRTQAALVESEARFRNVLSRINLLALIVDRDTRITFCNDHTLAVTGWKANELIGREMLSVLLPPEYRHNMTERVRAWIARGRIPRTIETEILTRSGQRRVVSWSTAILRGPDGSIVGATAVGADITERRTMENELRRLARVVEQGTEAVIIADTSGAIQYVNPAFERITGYRREEVLGKNPRILNSGRQPKEFYAAMWKTLKNGEAWRGSFTNRRKDGSLYEWESVISPIRDEAGAVVGYVSTARDVTRERQLEQQYQHAQRMESIGRLAGGIAHDFNNLLTAILGYSRMISEQLGEDHPATPDLAEIIRAGERAAGLTRQLLTFSRRQPVQTEPLSLNAVLRDLHRLLRRTLGEDIELVSLLDERNPFIYGDPTLLEQVVLNLALNARDAMPNGGTLTLKTEVLDVSEDLCARFIHAKPGTYAALTVQDTGVGMTREVMEHCFEPFFTTKPRGQGSGLGLSIVYNTMEKLGGFITVDSVLGKGSTFTAYFPLAQAASQETVSPPAEHLPRGHETVLVVEDEDSVRKLTVKLLQTLGYRVLEAQHGEEALRIFSQRSREIDIVLSDIVMPYMGGYELGERIREIRNDIPILYMSGFTDTASFERATKTTAPVLLKPFTQESLAQRIRQQLDKRPS